MMANFRCHLFALRTPRGLEKNAWHWNQGTKSHLLSKCGQAPQEQPRGLHTRKWAQQGWVCALWHPGDTLLLLSGYQCLPG